jgi:hypothetical protein
MRRKLLKGTSNAVGAMLFGNESGRTTQTAIHLTPRTSKAPRYWYLVGPRWAVLAKPTEESHATAS